MMAQDSYMDSLENAYAQSIDHVEQTELLYAMGDYDHTFRLSLWDSIIEMCNGYPELVSVQANAFNNSGMITDMMGDVNQAGKRYRRAVAMFDSIKDTAKLAMSIWNLSTHTQNMGEYDETIQLMNKAMKLYELIGDQANVAGCYNGLAVTYDYLGVPLKAMELYHKAYEYLVHTDDTMATANVLTNMATIHSAQGDDETAEKNYLQAIEMLKMVGAEESDQMLTNYNNLATVYWGSGRRDEALNLFETNLELQEKFGYIKDKASTLLNLAKFYAEDNALKKAELSFAACIKIYVDTKSAYDLSNARRDYGEYLYEHNRVNEGLEQANRSYAIALDIKSLETQWLALELLALINSDLKNFEVAFEYQKLHDQIGDSILNNETIQSAMSKKYELDYLTKTVTDSIEQAKIDLITAAKVAEGEAKVAEGEAILAAEKQQGYFLIGGLCMVLLFGLFILHRLRITRKQKTTIESQKKQVDEAFDQLEEKSNEILDSITYAKRIQSAILPTDTVVKKHLQDSLILYKPKDIVAGDFYWLESFAEDKDTVLFAAADCTGHGVPGAMVSVVCNNGLNRAVREHGLTDPGEILDKTREIVIAEFDPEGSEDEVKDGMDIAICSLNGLQLKYAGANNPLWIIRDNEILETKPNKQPIGKFDNPVPYTTHEFTLQKGDSFFIFSDGYADQFGGEKGKKLKSSNFKKLLLSICDLPMSQQKDRLDTAFEEWRGELEQLDDVCVIGVRVE